MNANQGRRVYSRLVIDIETSFCTDEGLEIEKSLVKAKGNFKETVDKSTGEIITVEEKKEAQKERYRGTLKDGCLDMNPIAIICIDADGDKKCVSWLPLPKKKRKTLIQYGFDITIVKDYQGLLDPLRSFLDISTDDMTYIMAWNGYKFDFSKIRHAFSSHAEALPRLFHPDSPNRFIDLQVQYGKFFECVDDRRKYISLEAACQLNHIKTPKTSIKGSDVPRLIAEGGHEYELIKYCFRDVAAENAIASRMGY